MTSSGRDLRASAVDAALYGALAPGRVTGVVAAVAGRDGTIYEGAFGRQDQELEQAVYGAL